MKTVRLGIVYCLIAFAVIYLAFLGALFVPLGIAILAIAWRGLARRRREEIVSSIRAFLVLGLLQTILYAGQWVKLCVKRAFARQLPPALLVLLALFAVGCAFEIPISVPGVRVTTNFPYNRYQLSVKNNIQGTLMKVEVNGVVVKRDIPAGENWVGGWFTLSPVRLSVVADFDDMGGRRIGSTYPREFYFDGYYQNANTWVVSPWDLQR